MWIAQPVQPPRPGSLLLGGRGPRTRQLPMARCRGLRGCFEASVGVAGAATVSSVLGLWRWALLAGFSGFAAWCLNRKELVSRVSRCTGGDRFCLADHDPIGNFARTFRRHIQLRAQGRTPIVAPGVEGAVRARLRSGDCPDDGWRTAKLPPRCRLFVQQASRLNFGRWLNPSNVPRPAGGKRRRRRLCAQIVQLFLCDLALGRLRAVLP